AEYADISAGTVTYTRLYNRQEHRFVARGRSEAAYDTNIICVNADQLPLLHRDLGPDVLAGRYAIGGWFLEVATFPAELHASLELVDEIWVASEFVRDSISAETDMPVHVVPIPLVPPQVPTLGRAELQLPDRFMFLFIFDYYSINARKNPLGLVEAF